MARKRPSPALVISILALLVASAGTAVAATHYLITSSKQIKPGAISIHNLSPATIAQLHASHTVVKYLGTIPSGSVGTSIKVTCPAGQQATGGGFGNDGPSVIESRPDPATGTPTAWVVSAANNTLVPPADQTQSVYVVCSS
jgi:hypothetical protein